MTQAERAAEYPVSKLKFLSLSAVSPHFERNITISSFIVTVLCGKYFQSVAANRQWELDFFYRLVCLGMEARKNIPLLNRRFQAKNAEKILILWMSMKAMENNSDFFLYPLKSWNLLIKAVSNHII